MTRSQFRLHRYIGAPIIIALVQGAPVSVQEDENGRLSIAVGFGAAGYDQTLFNCDGEKTFDRDVSMNTVNGIIDYVFPGGDVRVTAVAGTVNSSTGSLRTHPAGIGMSPPDFQQPLDGMIAGGLVGIESELIGIHGGILVAPDSGENKVSPSARVRVGKREAWFVQADYRTIRSAGQFPMTGLGVGFADSDRNRVVSGFAGFGAPMIEKGADRSQGIAVAGHVNFPIAARADLTLNAMFGDVALRYFGAGVKLYSGR